MERLRTFIHQSRITIQQSIGRVHPIVLTILVLTIVSMNLLANKELFRTEWVALDCGFVLSWLPFLIMDCLCKIYGGKTAAAVSIFGIIINLIFFGIFHLVALTPGMWGEYYATGLTEVNDALNATIGGSTWIVLGSALAMAISSIVNSLINIGISKMQKSTHFGAFAVRSWVSTAFSQVVDNFIFALVVSIPLFGWNLRQSFICALTAAAFELALEMIFSPLSYRFIEHYSGSHTHV